MPKGADLHNHLDGAVYAETFIRVGGEDGLCVDPVAKSFTKSQPIRSGAEPEPVCEEGDVKAADVAKTQKLYDQLVDSFSMRGFVPSEGETGHDHFFGTFAKFGGTDPRHTGEFLDEVSARAAAQNEQYLELMETPTWNRLNTITKDLAWREDLDGSARRAARQGLNEDLPAARAFWDQAETIRNQRRNCGAADAASGCTVKTRYIYQVFRNTPKELVFAQTLFGFELASADPRIVAINFVGAEDEVIAMADYAEHMRMIGFLRELYPAVHVSLHAGELAPGSCRPKGCAAMSGRRWKGAGRPHRPWRRRDVRGSALRPVEGHGRQRRAGRNQSHQQQGHPRGRRQNASLRHLSQIRRAGRALHRRRGRLAHRSHP